MYKLGICFFLFLFIISCKESTNQNNRAIYYFDLKSYFINQAYKLQSHNKPIEKTVSKDGLQEKKAIMVNDWNEEFSLFLNSDINKSSWRDSYKKDSSTNKIIYQAKSNQLITKTIEIYLLNKKPCLIKIHNSDKNYLSEKDEILSFYPDSIYKIQKTQKIAFGKRHVYLITGKL